MLRILTTVAMLIGLVVPSVEAAAAERVQDGGFDAAACTPSDCTSPVWSETTNTNLVGPICKVGTGNCGYFQGAGGVAPFSPPNWVQMGGPDASAPTMTWSVEQPVQIPAAPATLRFQLLIKDSSISAGSFVVKIDGTTVFSAEGTTPGYGSYAPVTVDVSAFAGGTRTVRFEATVTQSGMGSSDSFNVDAVSLDAADLPLCKGKPATIVGTDASELLVGTPGPDVIVAMRGDDVVKARGGKDVVCGGGGRDELRGQRGRDKLFGNDGNDRLVGGSGLKDLCNGGAGRDRAARSCERTRDL